MIKPATFAWLFLFCWVGLMLVTPWFGHNMSTGTRFTFLALSIGMFTGIAGLILGLRHNS